METGGGRFGQCGYVPGAISEGVSAIQMIQGDSQQHGERNLLDVPWADRAVLAEGSDTPQLIAVLRKTSFV